MDGECSSSLPMDLLTLDLPGIRKVASGKVREIFDLGDRLLLVATDRISAFDCILPNAIPRKGEVLNLFSAFWFGRFDFVPNHLLISNVDEYPEELQPFRAELALRSMIVLKAQPLPVECVVRGYLAGSGWKEYQQSQSICGVALPAGLRQAEKLPEPIFTPSTKAASGHDENISWDECCRLLGGEVAEQARTLSLRIYEAGRTLAAERGIIVADTKFEFGLLNGRVILIDEVPDARLLAFLASGPVSPSAATRRVSTNSLSATTSRRSTGTRRRPRPPLPAEVIRKTSEKYLEAYTRLTGADLSLD